LHLDDGCNQEKEACDIVVVQLQHLTLMNIGIQCGIYYISNIINVSMK
jgi:hypothetical protein